jgi:hypothetical protein
MKTQLTMALCVACTCLGLHNSASAQGRGNAGRGLGMAASNAAAAAAPSLASASQAAAQAGGGNANISSTGTLGGSGYTPGAGPTAGNYAGGNLPPAVGGGGSFNSGAQLGRQGDGLPRDLSQVGGVAAGVGRGNATMHAPSQANLGAAAEARPVAPAQAGGRENSAAGAATAAAARPASAPKKGFWFRSR